MSFLEDHSGERKRRNDANDGFELQSAEGDQEKVETPSEGFMFRVAWGR